MESEPNLIVLHGSLQDAVNDDDTGVVEEFKVALALALNLKRTHPVLVVGDRESIWNDVGQTADDN